MDASQPRLVLLRSQVLRAIRQRRLLTPEDRVAVALSGGPDSVGLVWVLADLARRGDLPGAFAGLIHVNHGLRGEEAARDEAFCRSLAARLDLPIDVGTFDVAARARAVRRSIEAAARDIRYAFFSEAASRLGATAVATGHTLDDQAETVLLRLLRGAGSRGLSGIRWRRGMFVRPLLSTRRADLRGYLADRGERFCEDSSNLSLAVPRNVVRHRLLPVIEAIAPGGIPALARAAALAVADERFLQREALTAGAAISRGIDAEWWSRGATEPVGELDLDAARLARLPAAIGRRVVRRALELVGVGHAFDARHVDAVRRLAAAARPSGHLDLPGVKVDRRGTVLALSSCGAASEVPEPGHPERPAHAAARSIVRGLPAFSLPLPVPGRVDLPGAGLAISADRADQATPDDMSSGGDLAVLQASAVRLPLLVRSREPGDRFHALGAPGGRKLQDLMVDRKIPRHERDRVPLVVDAGGRIVWVGGVAIADACRVTSPGTSVVVLKVHRKGSPT